MNDALEAANCRRACAVIPRNLARINRSMVVPRERSTRTVRQRVKVDASSGGRDGWRTGTTAYPAFGQHSP